MTRSEALAIITKSLETVDDQTLESAAAHLVGQRKPSGLTVGDIVEAFATDSVLPRSFTDQELGLIAQAKEDFQHGRTLSHDEAMARTDAVLAARRASRTHA